MADATGISQLMTIHQRAFGAAVLLLALLPAAHAAPQGGIGVLGDSYSDEYQFYPPDRSTARNWVEILAEARGLDFGRFRAGGWGEPRNGGYEFNWARSGATTDDLIAAGQHTGLAAQVAAGRVAVVWIFIGGNDFLHALGAPDPDAALALALPRALANYRRAFEAILGAHPAVNVVAATVPDIRHLPEFAGRLALNRAAAFTAAIARFNDQVRALAAADPRVALVDLDLLARLGSLLARDRVPVAGRRLDRARPGNDPDCFFLADGRHPGTLAQGQMARLFVATINAKFDAGIPPLTAPEVAGIAATAAAGRLLADSDPPAAGPAPGALAGPGPAGN